MAPAVTLAVGMHVWERARGLVDGIANSPLTKSALDTSGLA